MPERTDLAILHADPPLRVWSLIVTIFGDVVMDRGRDRRPAPLWTSDLMMLLELLGVEAGLVRTNLSRLVANGTLERGKEGRRTFYRLSEASAGDFAQAAAIIYGPDPRPLVDHVALAALDLCPDRKAARAALAAQGFRFLSSTLAMAARHDAAADLSLTQGVIFSRAEATPVIADAAERLWHLADMNAAYGRFAADFSACTGALDPERAVLVRLACVHRFRRLALRDPLLPAALLPADWQGAMARDVFSRVTTDVARPSQSWLAAHAIR